MATHENPVGPQHMQTFSVLAPKSTHFRLATCAQFECEHHREGFIIRADETTELGRNQGHYIRKRAGRRYRETRDEVGLTVFTFEPGQACFHTEWWDGRAQQGHLARIDRPELFLVRDGDKRGNPRGTKPHLHSRAEFWLEQFATNQDRIAAVRARG